MTFIPKAAKWYIADIVLEFVIEDDSRNVVHVNTMLMKATSPEDAYNKAMELGKSEETEYPNSDAKKVTVRFRGLRDLNVIHDELNHGAELSFEEEVGVSESAIRERVRDKSNLALFKTFEEERDIPNYSSDFVMKNLQAHFGFRENSHE